MFKKIGRGFQLAVALLVVLNVFTPVTTIYATPCSSVAACREQARERQNNIAEIIEEEAELSEDIAEIQDEISELRAEISVLETIINDLQDEILELSTRIAELADEMAENLEILEKLGYDIEDLLDQVAERMRIAQHANNRNSILNILNEAESFIDLIRQVRTFTRFAEDDVDLMTGLTELVERQGVILNQLDEQQEELQAGRTELEVLVIEQEAEQEILTTLHLDLSGRELDMLERMYELGLNRANEEEQLAAIEAAEEVLRRSPPPPPVVTRNNNSSNNSASSGSTASTPQTPNESGLAHPLPGARVSSPFGPRWGGHHAGIDLEIFSQPSAPILAAASGVVTVSTYGSGMGWYVVISHNINGQRVDTLYAHLRYQPMVSAGDTVSQGQQIGNKGSTGFSTGAHLHFEVHPGGFAWNAGVNPANWINF